MTEQKWISVPMIPVPKARARVTKTGHAFTPAKTVNAEAEIRQAWLGLYGNTSGHWPALAGLRMTVVVYVQRPPSIPKKRLLPTKRPDVDNFLKTCLDSLNRWAYSDDALITDVRVKKRYTPSPPTLHGGPGLIIMLEEDTDE